MKIFVERRKKGGKMELEKLFKRAMENAGGD